MMQMKKHVLKKHALDDVDEKSMYYKNISLENVDEKSIY